MCHWDEGDTVQYNASIGKVNCKCSYKNCTHNTVFITFILVNALLDRVLGYISSQFEAAVDLLHMYTCVEGFKCSLIPLAAIKYSLPNNFSKVLHCPE